MPLFGPNVPSAPPSSVMPSLRQVLAKFFDHLRASMTHAESGMASPPDPFQSNYDLANSKLLLDGNAELAKAKLELLAAADQVREASGLWPQGAAVYDELNKAIAASHQLMDNAIAMNALWLNDQDVDKVVPRLKPLLARNRELGAEVDRHWSKGFELLHRSTGITPPE